MYPLNKTDIIIQWYQSTYNRKPTNKELAFFLGVTDSAIRQQLKRLKALGKIAESADRSKKYLIRG